MKTTSEQTIKIATIEPRTWWTAELRRQFEKTSTEIRQFTTAVGIQGEERAFDLIIIDWSQDRLEVTNLNNEKWSELIEAIGTTNTVAIVNQDDGGHEWQLRELGCLDVIIPPITGPQLAQLIRRYTAVKAK